MHRLGAGGQRPAWHPQWPAAAADASTHAAAAADHTNEFIGYMGAEEGMAQFVGQPSQAGAEEESMLSGGSQPSTAWQE